MKFNISYNTGSLLKLGSVTLASLTCYYIWHIWNSYKFFKKRGLKTPPYRFLIGNLDEFMKDNNQAETIRHWTEKYGKTFGYFEGHTPVLVTSDLDFIQEVFVKQYSNFSAKKRRPLDRPDDASMVNLIQSTKSRWKRQRNIINPTFSNSKLRELTPTMIKCIDQLISDFDSKNEQEVNMTCLLKKIAADVVWKCALNTDDMPKSKIDQYTEMIAKVFKSFLTYTFPMYFSIMFSEFDRPMTSVFLLYNLFAYTFARGGDPLYWLREESIEILHNRRQNNTQKNDYLQLLMNAEVDSSFKDDKATEKLNMGQLSVEKKLTTDEIKTNLALFMIAGYETTSSTLATVFFNLAKYPDEQQRVYDEISLNYPYCGNPDIDREPDFEGLEQLEYMTMFIKETMRMNPIINPVVNRRCMFPTTIKGVQIPENVVVSLDLLSVHFDPDVWGPVDPTVFYPERFSKQFKRHPASFLGFGYGPRNCVGMKFAYVEMKFVLAKILRKFEVLACDRTIKDLKFIDGIAVRSLRDDVIVTLRKR